MTSRIYDNTCGACERFNPPDDKFWRARVFDQKPGNCRRKAGECYRDTDKCELFVPIAGRLSNREIKMLLAV